MTYALEHAEVLILKSLSKNAMLISRSVCTKFVWMWKAEAQLPRFYAS